MGDHLARAQNLEKKAEKKLQSWDIFGGKLVGAAQLYEEAANSFKLAKSWDEAGAAYVNSANCYIKLDSKDDAVYHYVDAAHCYKKSNINAAITCLEQSVNMFLEMRRFNISARYYKEIAELCEQEENLGKAIYYYDKAAELFESEDVTTSANQCRQKVAQFASQLEQYPKAIEIYEDIAKKSLSNNLLKYGVKGHLLNAGICRLCKGDVVTINNALEHYQDLDPPSFGTREYKLLPDLSAAIYEGDVVRFTNAVKEYDSMTRLSWICLEDKSCFESQGIGEGLKPKELEEDDVAASYSFVGRARELLLVPFVDIRSVSHLKQN
ncbi:membrane traffic protein [Lithospermum erythrorhizon]|uniref:Membrane traffic protein n=1 Tax=Lithospermum erythrorhizon TaxID=34254 RepID=A0AAV3R0W6_LITER